MDSLLSAPEASREAGLERLARFLPAAGRKYARSRNFDFGPERRGNVSLLSAYIRHRLLLETEVLETVLGQHSLSEADKFVQEVFWRAYFKGWLEQHPSVWSDYLEAVNGCLRAMEHDADQRARYQQAVSGATGIGCFDAWVHELVRSGYLHNHARMWFASIWVYTLELPWQLGADFFLRNLIDGDPASNTLSWRWVCGLHTRGKTYQARVSNIAIYTDNRFNPQGQLAVAAPPLSESRMHPRQPLAEAHTLEAGGRIGLLITEEDCLPETLFPELAPESVLALIATGRRSPLPSGMAAAEFRRAAVADAVTRAEASVDKRGPVIEAQDWAAPLIDWATASNLDTIVTAWTPVGPTADALGEAAPELERIGVEIRRIRRPYDEICWPCAGRGYFKLKNRIPSILEQLGIADAVRETAGLRAEA